MEIVKESAKAIVAFVVVTLAAYLGRKGLNLDLDTQQALTSALTGIAGALLVWLVPNKPRQS